MQRQGNYFLIFFTLLIFSAFVFLLSKNNALKTPASLISSFTTVFSRPAYGFLSWVGFRNSEVEKLKDENMNLSKKLTDQKKLTEDNKALNDQFQTTTVRSIDLLPANVVGAPRFLPGISIPEFLIIDVGEKDGARVGDAVVFKDNLVGKLTKVQNYLSEVTLINSTSSKFTGKTGTGVLGVVKGEGNKEIILDNVVLSDKLQKGDLVLTNAGLNVDSTGNPPNLIIGKITSIDRNPSDLFQKAEIVSFLDFSRLTKVFVVKEVR